MSKLLDLVTKRRKELKESWQDDLAEINVHNDLAFLYGNEDLAKSQANLILAFTVLAYDPHSGWLDMHKNRLDNKRKIMRSLGGNPEAKWDNGVIIGTNLAAREVKVWFMRYLRDWEWDTVMAHFDFAAEMNEFAGYRTLEEIEEEIEVEEDDKTTIAKRTLSIPIKDLAKGNIDKGTNLKQGLEARLKGEELWEKMKKKYLPLDTALEREGRMHITKAIDPDSWEQFIRSLRETDK